MVLALVGVGVGGDGGAEERDAEPIVDDVEAVFGIVEEADAVVAFGQVDPAVAGVFKTGAELFGAEVVGAFDGAVLDFVGGGTGVNVDGEGDLHQDAFFPPVDVVDEVDAVEVFVEDDVLDERGLVGLFGEAEDGPDGAVFDDLGAGEGVHFPLDVFEVVVDVPGVVIVGAVVEELEHVSAGLRGEDFAGGAFVEDRGEGAGGVELETVAIVFELRWGGLGSRGIVLRFFRDEPIDGVAEGGDVFGEEDELVGVLSALGGNGGTLGSENGEILREGIGPIDLDDVGSRPSEGVPHDDRYARAAGVDFIVEQAY